MAKSDKPREKATPGVDPTLVSARELPTAASDMTRPRYTHGGRGIRIEVDQAELELISILRHEIAGFRLTIIGSADGSVDIEAAVDGISGVGQGIDFTSAWHDITGREFIREIASTRG